MADNTPAEQQTDMFRCPGASSPISRAVHLGRMAQFYPECRQCQHREETSTLSSKRVKQLAETRFRSETKPLFYSEGVCGIYLNTLGTSEAHNIAAALGIYLRQGLPFDATPPVVVLGSDERALSPNLVAAVSEGLRWAGCHVADMGSASAAALAFAVRHYRTAGGILVGNPSGEPETVGFKFWENSAHPLSTGKPLDRIAQIYRDKPDRPTRTYGSRERLQAEETYLAPFTERYHALRPLRFVLDTPYLPVLRYLRKLLEPVACQIVLYRRSRGQRKEDFPQRIVRAKAHFGFRIGDDGETCQAFDERGQTVAWEHLFMLITNELQDDPSSKTIVLEKESSSSLKHSLCNRDLSIFDGGLYRASMHKTIETKKAFLGGGPTGRFWYDAVPDALMTLTLLLQILSQSDRSFSRVVDRIQPSR